MSTVAIFGAINTTICHRHIEGVGVAVELPISIDQIYISLYESFGKHNTQVGLRFSPTTTQAIRQDYRHKICCKSFHDIKIDIARQMLGLSYVTILSHLPQSSVCTNINNVCDKNNIWCVKKHQHNHHKCG